MRTTQDTILDALLPAVVFDGWTDSAMEHAALNAGLTPLDVKRAFPDGITQCLDYFAQRTDAAMIEQLATNYTLSSMKIRERIATAVMVRLKLMLPHREAIRRGVAFYLMPLHMAEGLKVLWRTVDAIWFAAGDTATDYNHYTKRALLAGVYQTTLQVWLNDTSDNFADTEDFLHRRIENVMQIEKLKARAREFKNNAFN